LCPAGTCGNRCAASMVNARKICMRVGPKPDLRYAALRRRELEAQLHVPHVQRIALQSPQTVKSTEPK
ncbi:MAG TPA: hypothetical protein VJS12_13850, partial [Steroidobacteraceae bacterium]|nr:hypothetical protein [Steroidobacteraceae bacterium]